MLTRAQKKAPVDTDLILDLYEALFRPSVDAGITDSAALRGWRNSSVGLRGWRYIPPNPKKIPDLIGGLERFATKKDLSPIARALLVHLEFVTIHPFTDGNGRLGRLFVWHAVQQSATDLLDKQRGSKPARRTRRPKPRVVK